MRLNDYFTEEEFACRCGCGQKIINEELVKMATEFRELINKPMVIHCVNRCKSHNYEVGGDKKSLHIDGRAMDFHVRNMSIQKLHEAALENWEDENILTGGLGIYDWGIHIDTATRRKWNEEAFNKYR